MVPLSRVISNAQHSVPVLAWPVLRRGKASECSQSAVHIKMVSTRSGKPMCDSSHFPDVSPVAVWLTMILLNSSSGCLIDVDPFNPFQLGSDWRWPFQTVPVGVWLTVTLSNRSNGGLTDGDPFKPFQLGSNWRWPFKTVPVGVWLTVTLSNRSSGGLTDGDPFTPFQWRSEWRWPFHGRSSNASLWVAHSPPPRDRWCNVLGSSWIKGN